MSIKLSDTIYQGMLLNERRLVREVERLTKDLATAEGVIERNEASIAALTKERDEAREHLQNVQLLSHIQGVCEGFDIAAPDALKQSESELAVVEAERDRLREELAEARKDSERLEFLISVLNELKLFSDFCYNYHPRYSTTQQTAHDTEWRRRIDEARTK